MRKTFHWVMGLVCILVLGGAGGGAGHDSLAANVRSTARPAVRITQPVRSTYATGSAKRTATDSSTTSTSTSTSTSSATPTASGAGAISLLPVQLSVQTPIGNPFQQCGLQSGLTNIASLFQRKGTPQAQGQAQGQGQGPMPGQGQGQGQGQGAMPGLGQGQAQAQAQAQAQGQGQGCSEVSPVDPEQVSCDLLVHDNAFDSMMLKRWQEQNKQALASLDCRKNALEAAKSEMNCLSQQSEMLQNQMQAVQASVMQALNNARQNMNTYTQYLQDRDSQLQEISSITQGLSQWQGETQKLIAALDAPAGSGEGSGSGLSIPGIEASQKRVAEWKKVKNEMVNVEKAALAGDCMRATPAVIRKDKVETCKPRLGMGYLTYVDRVLCRVDQNQTLIMPTKSGGKAQRSQSQLDVNKGTALSLELQQVLQRMLTDFPQHPNFNVTGGQAQDARSLSNDPNPLLTKEAVLARYSGELAKFSDKGLDVVASMKTLVNSCFAKAETSVADQQSKSSTSLGGLQYQITQEESRVTDSVNSIFNSMSSLSTGISQYLNQHAITGDMHAQLYDTATLNNCRGKKPDIQLSCLKKLRNQIEGFMNGTATESVTTIRISGRTSAYDLPIQCAGLNGCALELSKAMKLVQRDIKQKTDMKKQSATNANKMVDNMVMMSVMQLGSANAALNMQTAQLNSILAGLGVTQLIDVQQKIQGEDLVPDGRLGDGGNEGLYMAPKSMMSVIGGKLSMIDMPSALSGAQQGLGELMTKLKESYGTLNSSNSAVQTMGSTCRDKARAGAKQEASQLMQQFVEGGCTGLEQYCLNNGAKDTLANLLNDLNLALGSSLDSGASSGLMTGSDVCREVAEDYKNPLTEDLKCKDKGYLPLTSGLPTFPKNKCNEAEPKLDSAPDCTLDGNPVDANDRKGACQKDSSSLANYCHAWKNWVDCSIAYNKYKQKVDGSKLGCSGIFNNLVKESGKIKSSSVDSPASGSAAGPR